MSEQPDVRELALAIDIGGTKMAVGLVDRSGTLIDRESVRTDRDKRANDLFESLGALIVRQIQRGVERHGSRIVVVGIGSAGPIEPNCASISPINIPAWQRFPLHEAVADVVRQAVGSPVPVFGDLDAKAFALAEGWLGAARGVSNFIGMVVSTGIGGGIVVDGELLDGATGNAGHIGHVIVDPEGHRCGCGARGCLEAEASGTAIESITGRPPTEPSYETMQRTGRLVGLAVASTCNLFDLKLAVVGGSVALGFGPTFFAAAQEVLDRECQLSFTRGARIVPARLGDQGPLVGASAIGWRGLNRRS
ncbi:MAG: ROK family protein [Ilumatobacteraceae bacterium]|jgi:glucokinase|nr:ROK family protein [Actinomycetota bacterium]MDA3012738.1 ROK family protein [Actinomycetota bacterium]MDA3025676.1 ROK family protein [Actinomycetota bacterium]